MSPDRDPDRDAAWRAARRAAALRHHPDRGGDAASLHAALEAVDRAHRRSATGPPPVQVRVSRRRRLARRLGAVAARLAPRPRRERRRHRRWTEI